MNLTTIQAKIDRAMVVARPALTPETIKLLATARNWPILTYDFGTFENLATIEQRVRERYVPEAGKTFATPFRQFRYWTHADECVFQGVCWKEQETLTHITTVENSGRPGVALGVYVCEIVPPAEIGEAYFKTRLFRIDSGTEETGHPELKHEAIGAFLLILCGEFLRPDLHVVTVTPDRPHKSVQWLRSQTHYTVLHRHHAANMKDAVKGAVISQDEGKHLTRLAHSRRAHYRLLRSERYKKTRGLRIFIKDTWVGPKEWRDTAGQIYRIQEL